MLSDTLLFCACPYHTCMAGIPNYFVGKQSLPYTVDREIFTLKIIRVKIFMLLNFHGFVQSAKFLLTVDYCNMIWTSAWRVPGV